VFVAGRNRLENQGAMALAKAFTVTTVIRECWEFLHIYKKIHDHSSKSVWIQRANTVYWMIWSFSFGFLCAEFFLYDSNTSGFNGAIISILTAINFHYVLIMPMFFMNIWTPSNLVTHFIMFNRHWLSSDLFNR
jgi:hypothetical protein